MCGIAGFLDATLSTAEDELQRLAAAMAGALRHRGPDDRGTWSDATRGVALGHQRLSIIDLSPLGHQPMDSPSGRYTAVFNGELYNYRALRSELEPDVSFRSTSDTEVLLAAIDRWGIDEALRRSNAMLALAVWDRERRELLLARDRFGEKPLYFGVFDGCLLFGSELKSLRAHPRFEATIDRRSVASYLRYKYVPTPWTIYQRVAKLRPGTILVASTDGGRIRSSERTYWSAADEAARGRATPWRGTDEDAVDELERRLTTAVELRRHADVALGAFLSGGVDSSTVVALLQRTASQPTRTFTVGFESGDFDEAESARAVAAHLGTAHTEVAVSAADCLARVPDLAGIYDEPFGDSSQLPTLLVCEAARRHVTVALSGDGGDELFGGYNRYRWAPRLARVGRVPRPLRQAAGAGLRAVRPDRWDAVGAGLMRVLPARAHVRLPGDRVTKLAGLLDVDGDDQLYLDLTSEWSDAGALAGSSEHPAVTLPADGSLAERMMLADTLGYLPDDLLVKVDRAAMSTSLETRVPFLDPDVFSFVWSLPAEMRVGRGGSRWALRQVLYRSVPRGLVDRPKLGFDPPIGDWLRGPLREWASELLSEPALRAAGLDPHPVREAWDLHQRGATNAQDRLWTVLMLQSWLQQWA